MINRGGKAGDPYRERDDLKLRLCLESVVQIIRRLGQNVLRQKRNARLMGITVACYCSAGYRVGRQSVVDRGSRAPMYVATVHRQ